MPSIILARARHPLRYGNLALALLSLRFLRLASVRRELRIMKGIGDSPH
jgi:hypothetical protein